MSGKRLNVISKKDAYMLIAKVISQRSKDPRTQVGAVIVSNTDRILSTGYNGFPNGCSDDDFPWEASARSEYNTKYPYVCHAELNAILNFRGNNRDLEDSSLYVTLFPCNECAKAIIQSGISKVYYETLRDKNDISTLEAQRMLDAAGITCFCYRPTFNSLDGLIKSPQKMIELQQIATLEKENKNGCSGSGVRYCSNCGAMHQVFNVSNYCYQCGFKFKK